MNTPRTTTPSPAFAPPAAAPATPSFAEAFRFWLKLGFISFGGPAGQIAIMHRELVDERRWISERRAHWGAAFDRLGDLLSEERNP